MGELFVLLRRALALLVLAGGALAACSSTTSSKCTFCTSAAIVKGTVRDTLGAPKPGVSVALQIFAGSCSGASVSFLPLGGPPPPTDTTGRYRYNLETVGDGFWACVSAKATLLADTMFGADTVVTGHLVQFRNDYPQPVPQDSLTIDLVLRHR